MLNNGKIVYEGNVDNAIKAYSNFMNKTKPSVENCFSRGGCGGVIIEQIWISNKLSNDGGKVFSNETMCIYVSLTIMPQYINKNISVGVAIDNMNGKRLFTNVSSWENQEIVADSDKAIISCSLESLPLIPGKYLISAAVLYQTDTLDCVVHCADFEICSDPSSFFISRDKDQGDMYIPCHFKVANKTLSLL